jgi:hypothetical protein
MVTLVSLAGCTKRTLIHHGARVFEAILQDEYLPNSTQNAARLNRSNHAKSDQQITDFHQGGCGSPDRRGLPLASSNLRLDCARSDSFSSFK